MRRRAYLAGAATLATAGCLGTLGGGTGVTVGLPRSNPPFAYRSRCCTWEANPLEGFDVALLGLLGDRLTLELSYTDADLGDREFEGDGTVRILAPGTPLPAAPDGTSVFVAPTFRGFQCLLVQPAVTAPADLGGRSVLVPPGPGQDSALARLRDRVPDVTVVRPADTTSARARFADGEGAALLADQVTNARAATDGEATILRGRTPASLDVETPYLALAAHRYGYILRAEDALAARLGDALAALRETDRYVRLREQFFRPDGLPRPR